MNPQEYILSQLERLKESSRLEVPPSEEGMVDFIYSAVTSKKFRKFSLPEINKRTIRAEIQARVDANEPITFHFPFGGYKLWRLEESPEPDWGELFSIIYYVRWLKPICDVYKPGVRFAFRFDEVVVKKLNNILESETEQYRKTFEHVLAFVKQFAPKNFEFEIFLERSRYDSYEAFQKELQVEIDVLRAQREKERFTLSDEARAMIDLNVRLEPGQADNPNWREENDLVHMAYYALQNNKKHPRKHYEAVDIVAFPSMFGTKNIVAIGTTKTSMAKFWVGVGALKKKDNSYIETVLSPPQLKKADFVWVSVHLDGLEGKNFNKVRVLN